MRTAFGSDDWYRRRDAVVRAGIEELARRGWIRLDRTHCPACGGEGMAYLPVDLSIGLYWMPLLCRTCDGRGWVAR
jgi:hypothetical protein